MLATQGAEELCHALLRHVRSACAAPDNTWLALRLVAALGPHVSWLVLYPALVQCTVCMLLRYALPDMQTCVAVHGRASSPSQCLDKPVCIYV